MRALFTLLGKRHTCRLLCAAIAGWLLLAGPVSAQLTILSPAADDILLTGQSTQLSVTVPTSETLTTADNSYARVMLEVLIEPRGSAESAVRDAFEQSGMVVEFASGIDDGGVMVRDQNGDEQTVFGDATDGEIRLGTLSDPVLGVAAPTPGEDSSFRLTVIFSDTPADGATDIAVPTSAEVSAIIAAVQIFIPPDSNFEDDFLLRVTLTSPEGGNIGSMGVVLDAEPLPPEIVITPPDNSTPVSDGLVLVVAPAAGAMTEVFAGEVLCSGRRCSTPRPYFVTDSCGVTLEQTLPSACISADEDGDGRPELPVLYSHLVWVVSNDSERVQAQQAQRFYVAPVIGFDIASKVIPATTPAAISVGLSISAVPEGASLGSVMVQPMMGSVAEGGPEVFDDETARVEITIDAPRVGTLTFEFSDPDRDSATVANYARLMPDDPDNTDNYLYAAGNDEVEIAELQGGLIRFESAAPLPQVTTASLTINGLSVTTGTVTYRLTQAEVTVNVLNNPDASSLASVVFDMNDLTVVFGSDVLRDGDIIELALALVHADQEPSSTRVRSLLFPVMLSGGVAGDADGNNVPDDEQGEGIDVLPVYDVESSESSPIRVSGGGDVKLVLGAYALNVALLKDPDLYSAAFSPEDIQDNRDDRDDALPGPPSYNRGGIFDFSVIGLDNPGDVVTVFIPLLGEASGGAHLSKYSADDDGNFGWNRFTSNQDSGMPGFFDRVWSAPKAAGVCPVVGAARGDGEEYAWRSADEGLRSGDACVLLQIQDGGVNDGDGLVNGVIYDPNAVTGGGGGGGGAMGWAWLLALWMGLWGVRGRRRIQAASSDAPFNF